MAIRAYKGKYRAYFKYQGKQYSQIVSTKAEGKTWEVKKKEEIKKAVTETPILMFSVIAEQYLTDCEIRMQSGSTGERYNHLTELANYLSKDVPVSSITSLTAKQYTAQMQQKHGNKSANRRLRTLKACWNWHKEMLTENPWRSVTPYPEEEYQKYVPPPEDVGKIMEETQQWEHRILMFLLHTGARIGELYQLTWGDINMERNTVMLWTRKRKGSCRQSRLISMSGRLQDIIKELQKENTENNQYVFTNPLTKDRYRKLQPSVRYMLKRLCAKAEVKAFGFHALRHFVSLRLMDSRKASIMDIQLLLGHQRATTTDIYLKSLSSSISHLASIIDEEIVPQKS